MDRPSRIAALLGALSLLAAGCVSDGRLAMPKFAARAEEPEPTFARHDEETQGKSSRTKSGTRPTSTSKSAPAPEDDSPFVASKDRATRSRPASETRSTKTAAGDAARAKSASGTNPNSVAKASDRSGAPDAETAALIEEELQDVAPEERAALRKDLATLDPATIRLILGNRRMLRKHAQNGTAADAPVVQTSAVLEGNAGTGHTSSATSPAVAGTTGHSTAPGVPGTAPTATGGSVPTGHSLPHPGTSSHVPSAGIDTGASLAAGSGFLPQSATTGLGTVSPWGQSAPERTADAATTSGPWPNPAPAAPVAAGAPPTGRTAPPTGLAGPSPWDRLGPPTWDASAPQGANAAVPPTGTSGLAATGPQLGTNNGPTNAAWPGTSQTVGYGPDVRTASAAFGSPWAGSEIPPGTNGAPATHGTAGFAASPEMQRVLATAAAEAAQLAPGTTDAQREEHVRRQVYLRMLYLVSGQNHRALEAIPGIEPADQEFWQQVFWGMANYFDREAIADPRDRAGQTIAQLRTAVMRLQEKARLELRNVNFCRRIQSYGTYDRFERDEFAPGQPVLIYAEVANFKSEATAEGQYRTLLKSTVEIYRAGTQGELVERIPFSATEDLCRNHRRDYFHSYEFAIPQRLSLGPHVLKLVVEDQLSRKVSTATVNFTVK